MKRGIIIVTITTNTVNIIVTITTNIFNTILIPSWVKMDNESVLSGHTGHSEPPTSRLSKSNLNNLNNKVGQLNKY